MRGIQNNDPICVCGHSWTSHGPCCMEVSCPGCTRFIPRAQPALAPAKRDWLLFTWKAAEAVMEAIEYGAHRKHKPNDWRTRYDQKECIRKVLRHLVKHIGGEAKDPESGLPHLSMAAADLLFALEV